MGNERTGAQGNFKGDDSPGGTDLSARLSFTKRALEVKATNEAVVFKKDYPRDDKSIEDDKRPNRSRVSEATGMYRRSISDTEKFGRGGNGRSGNIRDIGDVRISRVADEKLRRSDEYQNDIVNMYRGSNAPNVTASKIKRKRISRGVQYSGCQNHAKQFLPSCFGSKSNATRYNSAREAERKEVLSGERKFFVGSRNQANESLNATAINNESDDVKLNNIDTKREKFESSMKKIAKVIRGRGMNHKIFVPSRNTDDNEKRKKDNNPKNREAKINPLEKLRPSEALTRNFENKKETAECNFENNPMNGACKHESQDERNANIFYHRINSNNARKKTIVNFNRESIANRVKERLDSCIVELNGIIGDACVIFDSGKSTAEKNS